jgi:hypothetical protein
MTVMKAIREYFRKIKEESGDYLSVAHGERETTWAIFFAAIFFVVGGWVACISHYLVGSFRVFYGMALIAACFMICAFCRLEKHYPLKKGINK